MAYHNAGETMPRACGFKRIRTHEARGHVGGSETVPCRRGIDHERLHRLGLDRIRNAFQRKMPAPKVNTTWRPESAREIFGAFAG
jgi:hypothetical protein